MKLAIVGANGQIGTELCFLFREDSSRDNIELIPIVRNSLGAAFLSYNGFDCRVSDIGIEEDAKKSLSDIDVVIIAAYTSDVWGSSKKSVNLNKLLIRNSVKFSKPNSKIIYFSSIRAFSSQIDENTPLLNLETYDAEKRYLEKILQSICNKEGKTGYSLRLGHVVGQNSSKTRKFRELLSDNVVHVQVSPNKSSNVLHTITLKEAIVKCAKTDLSNGTYTLVNSPQWTWKEVLDYYNIKKSKIIFDGDLPKQKTSFFKKILNKLLIFKPRKRFFFFLRMFLPKEFDEKFQHVYLLQKTSSEIASLELRNEPKYVHEFGYKTAPGKFISGLTKTKTLLKKSTVLDKVF